MAINKEIKLSIKLMNNENKIIIFGCGHAKAVIDIIESNNEFKIIGLIGKENDLGKKY